MANLDFPGLFKGPEDLLPAGAQNFTANWVDLGAQQYVAGAVAVGVWLELEINNSTNMRVRLLGSYASGGDEFTLPIRTVGAAVVHLEPEYEEFNVDEDRLMIVGSALDGVIPYVQVQIQVGAVGAPAAAQVMTAMMTTSGRD